MPETITKIKELAKRIFGFPEKPKTDITSEIEGWQRPVSKELAELDKQSIREDRRTKIADCQQMAKTDSRVRRMLKKLADDSIVGGLQITVEEATNEAEKEKAQVIINQTKIDCMIDDKLEGWGKSCLREGDLFLQVYIDEQARKIYRLKKLATVLTFSNMDSEGNFPKGQPAYYQEHPLTRIKTKEFETWQIVHIPWEYEDGQPYGEPMFSAARLAWKRLDNGEKNVTIRRATRAGKRLQHKIGTADSPDWQLVNKYKIENRDTLDNPTAASQDFFTTGNIEITEIGGDSELGELKDISHFEGLVFMASGIPVALLSGGREESINRDVLEEQEEDFFRVIGALNKTFENGLRKVFNLALLLQGINPDAVTYAFNWGNKDRSDLTDKIEHGEKMQKLGYSFETIYNTINISKSTYEEELERIKKQVADNVIPYGIGMVISPAILQALMGMQPTQQSSQIEQLIAKLDELKSLAESQIVPSSDKIVAMKQGR